MPFSPLPWKVSLTNLRRAAYGFSFIILIAHSLARRAKIILGHYQINLVYKSEKLF